MTKQSTSGAWDASCPRWSVALTSTKEANITNRTTDFCSLVHLAFHFHHVTRWLTKSQNSNSNRILQLISFLKMTKWLRFLKLKANKTLQQITVSYWMKAFLNTKTKFKWVTTRITASWKINFQKPMMEFSGY